MLGLIKHFGIHILNKLKLLNKIIVIRDYVAFLFWQIVNEPHFIQLVFQQLHKFSYSPKISIVIPVYNPPPKALKGAIESVLRQTYTNWELCIADASQNEKIRKFLLAVSSEEKRIKVKFLEKNYGIAINTNEAINLSSGDYIGFLDHDDELSPFALFEIVSALNLHPNTELIYSDEDLKTDYFHFEKNKSIIQNLINLIISNKRFSPIFKPDFSIDLMRSCNYMTHFIVVRRETGHKVGWLRDCFEGAQDYDFLLRIIERSKNIIHIPKILYHWRKVKTSTANSIQAKPYANDSGKRSLQDHLMRCGISAKVSDGYIPTWYKVNYDILEEKTVSIIIPNRNCTEYLTRCIGSILIKSSYTSFEIIIVENNSTDEDIGYYYTKLQVLDPRIRIIKWNKPFNYHQLNNWAANFASGEILLFLNNDTEVVSKNWLQEMVSLCIRQDVGFVGAKLLYPNKTIQHAGITIGKGGVAGHDFLHYPHDSPGYFGRLVLVRNVSAVTGACLMVRKEVFNMVGGFDENYALSYGDVDICLKAIQKGLVNVWTPHAVLYHYESVTRGYETTPERKERFEREKSYFLSKWQKYIEQGDPYYNPNLSLRHSGYVIRIF